MVTCVGGQWQAQTCAIGCEGAQCAACTDGATACSAKNTVETCTGGQWVTSATSCSSEKVAVNDESGYFLSNFNLTAWGRGLEGELGNGTTPATGSVVPVSVASLAGRVADIEASSKNACALLVDGTVWCWGSRHNGMLGDGIDGAGAQSTPVQIPGLANVTQLAMGGTTYASNSPLGHACAVSNGAVTCWGDNSSYQLGVATAGVQKPVAVPGLAGVTQVAVGDTYSCALVAADGSVHCWGSNTQGELGLGTSGTPASSAPAVVKSLVATRLYAGRYSTCAQTKATGTYVCWGDNDAGELGLGNESPTDAPTAAPLLTGSSALAVSLNHSCAVSSGAASCWGDNVDGSLGNGSTVASLTPVAVTGLGANVTSIAVTLDHVCASVSGAVWCWGNNDQGQLGNGTSVASLTPKHQ